MIDREKVLKEAQEAVEILRNVDEPTPWYDFVRVALESALELLKAQEPRWVPFIKRPLTEEEKNNHPDWCYILDCALPYDDEDILVSKGKYVWYDTYLETGDECHLDSGHDIEDGMAWMPLPEPYKGE